MDRHYASVRKVLKHISTNPNDIPSVAQLSRVACVAPFHFHRVFRRMVGQPIGRYIRRLKLDYSLYQVLCTSDTIIQIALQAGYQSHEAFTRAFERNFGAAPSAVRTRCGYGAKGSEASGAAHRLFAVADSAVFPVAFRTYCLPQRSVFFRPHFGPYIDIPECWKRLRVQLTEAGISTSDCEAIGILYDDPVRYTSVRYDACVSVRHPVALHDFLGVQVLPGIDGLSTAYHGDYSSVFYTCVRLMNAWIMSGSSQRPRLPCYEIYEGIPFSGGSEEVHSEVCVELK